MHRCFSSCFNELLLSLTRTLARTLGGIGLMGQEGQGGQGTLASTLGGIEKHGQAQTRVGVGAAQQHMEADSSILPAEVGGEGAAVAVGSPSA